MTDEEKEIQEQMNRAKEYGQKTLGFEQQFGTELFLKIYVDVLTRILVEAKVIDGDKFASDLLAQLNKVAMEILNAEKRKKETGLLTPDNPGKIVDSAGNVIKFPKKGE